MKEHKLKIEDFELDEIESIEFIGEEDTIDITVEDTHMFFANDIYTHNSSLTATLVESNQIGGSIKRGQIGHFVFSIAKTLQQKEEGRATLAILKSRFGKDGVVFDDIEFDNGKMSVDTSKSSGLTITASKDKKVSKNNERVAELLSARNGLLKKTSFEGDVLSNDKDDLDEVLESEK